MITISQLISEKTVNFTGRQFVFDAITAFMSQNDRGFFLLTGDPGAGKTSVLAEHVRRTRCVSHFNIRSQGLNTASHFLRSLVGQMEELYGSSSMGNPSRLEADGESVAKVLAELRARTPADQPLVIAIDAMDEVAIDSGQIAGTNPLYMPSILGEGVYLILTTRRLDSAIRFESPFKELDLEDYLAETAIDVQAYIRRMLALPDLANRVDASNTTKDDFVVRLAEMSKGNFMYLDYVIKDILRAQALDLDDFLVNLPLGLENYYEQHWKLMTVSESRSAPVDAWIVYVLCEAQLALPAWVIASAIKPVTVESPPFLVQQRLEKWIQFLHRDASFHPTRFNIYHESFRDFLHRSDIVSNAGLDLRGVNQVIADLLWNHEFGSGANA